MRTSSVMAIRKKRTAPLCKPMAIEPNPQSNGHLTVDQLAVQLRMSPRVVRRYLRELCPDRPRLVGPGNKWQIDPALARKVADRKQLKHPVADRL